MNTLATFKKGLARIAALSSRGDYEGALARVGELLRSWPDNPHLLLMQAELIQLGGESSPALADARAALERSAALDPEAPQTHLELGQFKFAVEDAAKDAVKDFDRAIALCQRLLREALTGKAKALAELGKREEALGCLAAAYWQQTQTSNGNGHAKEILTSLEELRSTP
jgi:tetratricopeptide (TPR) repeat protein